MTELPIVVAYAPGASLSRVLIECLFVSVFQTFKRPILIQPGSFLHDHYYGTPDVFVFSVLSGSCKLASKPACQKMVANYFERCAGTQLVMLSGERWDMGDLDERVLLLSTMANVPRLKHIHLSMASASFAERLGHSPLSLLAASEPTVKTKFCADLYANCKRIDPKRMYDELNALRPVDALGKCARSSRPPHFTKLASRDSIWHNDEAVSKYLPYKFCHRLQTGYMTEKLANAFLAGSIPVYYRDPAVAELFNPKNFIDCARFRSLRDCAEYVVQVDDSPELYARMLQEPPVSSLSVFNEAFSWHPAVQSREMANAVLKHV